MKKKVLWVIVWAVFAAILIAGLTSCDFFNTGSTTGFSITFYVDGDAVKTINVTSGTTTIEFPPDPTKSGYVFDDWYYDKDVWQRPFTVQSLSGNTANVKIYARWKKEVTASFFTASEGTLYALFELVEGDDIPLPETNPTKTGYTFTEWRDASDNAVPAKIGTENLMFYGTYAPNTYKVYLGILEDDFEPQSNDAVIGLDFLFGYYFEVQYDQAYAQLLNSIDVSAGGVLAYWKTMTGVPYVPTAKYSVAGDTYLEPSWALPGTAGVVYEYIATGEYADTFKATGYSGVASDVTVAMRYNGKPVSYIAFAAGGTVALIETIVLQNSVLTIGANAFLNCPNLQEIVIPSSVAIIGANAFPASQGIQIYTMRADENIPAGWGANWMCGNPAIYNQEVYDEQFFDKTVPVDLQVSGIRFDVIYVHVLNAGGIAVSPAANATISPDGRTVTFAKEDLTLLDAGEYTVELTGEYLTANFRLVVGYSGSFRYDKHDNTDLEIRYESASDVASVHGAGITEGDYTVSKSTDRIVFDKEYLMTLQGGEHLYLLIYEDGSSQTITATVFDSEAAPYNVKLDLDADDSYYTILFDCDYDGAATYSYRIDGGAYQACESGMTIAPLPQGTSHTLEVRCNQTGKTGSYTLPALTAATSYLTDTFTFNGRRYDSFIADQSELNIVFAYLAQQSLDSANLVYENPDDGDNDIDWEFGCVIKTVYLPAQFAFSSAALTEAAHSFDFVYSYRYSYATIGQTVKLYFTLNSDQSERYMTGYAPDPLTDGSSLTPLAVPETTFAIDSFTRTETVTSVYELDNLPFGVKPVFPAGNSDAKTIYNAAREICGLYIDNDLTDAQKVTIIYEWLAINVTYDYWALDIMNLQNSVNVAGSLNAAKTAVTTAVNNNNWHTLLESALESAKDNATSLDDLQDRVDGIIKSLTCFSLYGVFGDAGNRIAVCDGYASALKLMCLIEGIECIEVTGWAGENHAWNKVKIDGDWYVVDSTWSRVGNQGSKVITHQWLLVSDRTALSGDKAHEEENREGVASVQVLATGDYDYYEANGLLITSQSALNALFAARKSAGKDYVEFVYAIEGVPSGNAIGSAILSLGGGSYTTYSPANDKNVFMVNIGNL